MGARTVRMGRWEYVEMGGEGFGCGGGEEKEFWTGGVGRVGAG